MKDRIGRSTYRNWHFLCSSGHISKILAWNYEESKPCLTCEQPAYRFSHWTDNAKNPADRPMYFINSNGQVLFPGHKDDKPPAGFEVRHITSISDRDQFYRQMDEQARREHDQYASSEQASFEYAQEQNRRELRQMMEQGVEDFDDETGLSTGRLRPMSYQEREIAREAMEQSNHSGSFFNQKYDPNFYIEAFEFDQSNRRPHNSEETGWRDRY